MFGIGMLSLAALIVGLLVGLALIPGIAFGLGKSLSLNGLSRILWTVTALASRDGLALVQRDRGPRYDLRVLLNDGDGQPDGVYLGREALPPDLHYPFIDDTEPRLTDSDVVPELRLEGLIRRIRAKLHDFWARHGPTRWDLDIRALDDDGIYYRMGKRPFVLLVDDDVLERERIIRNEVAAADGGVLALDEERGGRQTWTPFADTRDKTVVSLDPMKELNAETDYEGQREVVRRTLPEHGDQSGMSELLLVLLAVGMFLTMFVVTLVMF